MSMFSIFAVILIGFFGVYIGLDVYSSLIIGAVFAIIYSFISFYFADRAVLALNGAHELKKSDSPELYRIVENLTIASGIPMPKVYIVDDPSPNAFATGRDPKHASIAFTTGILRIMNKQEIEGVTAHELSHIKNYDIRIMTIIVVLIGLIVVISDLIFRIGIYSRHGKNDKGNGGTIILVIGLILGILSPIIAQIIKLAISRTREYLADQSAVLLTRHPDGLASALEKLRDNNQPLKNASNATAHLYISNPFGSKNQNSVSWTSKLFMTHPPINDRIQKLRKFDE